VSSSTSRSIETLRFWLSALRLVSDRALHENRWIAPGLASLGRSVVFAFQRLPKWFQNALEVPAGRTGRCCRFCAC
jgi:hypothetical protein